MSQPLEDYALLGDGITAALLSRQGAIDWLCWPRFDGDACFAALLGNRENGHWTICPDEPIGDVKRRYQDDTLIVETDFHTASGAVRVTDFMPAGSDTSSVVRIISGISGRVPMRSTLLLRFDYGALAPWCDFSDGAMIARVGPDLVVLRASVTLGGSSEDVETKFYVGANESVVFTLSYGASDGPLPAPLDHEAELRSTQQYWRTWLSSFDCTRTVWPAAAKRSLLTLKALTHRSTGASVAAPTTSLPELFGGAKNWDYRYCWLRDASFSLVALLNAGFQTEARAWRDWLLRAAAGSPENIRIMYRVDGGRHLHERNVDRLAGYRYSRPVRVGNLAASQHQVDVLGEVIDCLAVAAAAGIAAPHQQRILERRILAHVEQVWHTPGSGVWESRGEPRHYTYSRVMAWVAVDRYVSRLDASTVHEDPFDARMRALRTTIREEILHEGWNASLNTFTQFYGGSTPDASLLLLPLVGFLPATDPRMAATISVIQKQLDDHGLIRRTPARHDGMDEGAFIACSCWMADCLMLQGRHAEACEQFERVLSVANDVGLLSEEYDVGERRLCGNFPQTLTHLAVINTALGLCGPTLQRGGG